MSAINNPPQGAKGHNSTAHCLCAFREAELHWNFRTQA